MSNSFKTTWLFVISCWLLWFCFPSFYSLSTGETRCWHLAACSGSKVIFWWEDSQTQLPLHICCMAWPRGPALRRDRQILGSTQLAAAPANYANSQSQMLMQSSHWQLWALCADLIQEQSKPQMKLKCCSEPLKGAHWGDQQDWNRRNELWVRPNATGITAQSLRFLHLA